MHYNIADQAVFLVHHKKADLWIAPGGHIDEGEISIETLKREMQEELVIEYFPDHDISLAMLSIVHIPNPKQTCNEHLDIWYFIPTDGSDFNVDTREFHETRWLSMLEARKLVVDPSNLRALDKFVIIY